MRFTALATLFIAASAVKIQRDLTEKANGEAAAWKGYTDAIAEQSQKQSAYLAKRVTERKEEADLKQQIADVNAQEDVVTKAEEDSATQRGKVSVATVQVQKALETYIDMITADALDYKK